MSMVRSTLKFLLVLFLTTPLASSALACGPMTPLCVYGPAVWSWLTGGVVVATGTVLMNERFQHSQSNIGDFPAGSFRGGTSGSFILALDSEAENDIELRMLNRELEINDFQGKFTWQRPNSFNVSATFGPYDYNTCQKILNSKCFEGETAQGETVYGYAGDNVAFFCRCVPIH